MPVLARAIPACCPSQSIPEIFARLSTPRISPLTPDFLLPISYSLHQGTKPPSLISLNLPSVAQRLYPDAQSPPFI